MFNLLSANIWKLSLKSLKCVIVVERRKKDQLSFYLPDTSDEKIIRGLECLRREGQLFWNNIRSESIRHFGMVLDDSDRAFDNDSDNDESSSGDESVDSEWLPCYLSICYGHKS